MKIEKEADLGGLSSMKVFDCLSLKWCLKRKRGVASSELRVAHCRKKQASM